MDPHHLHHHVTHSKISTFANFMDPRHPSQNFDPRHPRLLFVPRQNFMDPHHPRLFFDPCQNFTDPRHPHKSLTHATHEPMHPRCPRHPRYLADSFQTKIVSYNYRKLKNFVSLVWKTISSYFDEKAKKLYYRQGYNKWIWINNF